ncbi:hypothetical protein ACFQ88_06575 [Paenibacillus sp. NPDC056579]|uniref:hypothetical protein n=1 Tax=Paenibacillus sp. NPDC056579 TaxID=3345871 RepID=UPI0036926A3C
MSTYPIVDTEFDRRNRFIFSLFNRVKQTLSVTFTAGYSVSLYLFDRDRNNHPNMPEVYGTHARC